jgi:hypothetical protein
LDFCYDDVISHQKLRPRSDSDLVSNYGHYSNFIPGLNFIRNQVIKPLLFATEKVVEHYI